MINRSLQQIIIFPTKKVNNSNMINRSLQQIIIFPTKKVNNSNMINRSLLLHTNLLHFIEAEI